eukprot:GHVU01147495.1.p3 GENE.GHVU01147495.1~~GHVU01147495.1.p3  ORF type:complete len:214 (+),score=17.21 GHVU01147495.1:281-922(+)
MDKRTAKQNTERTIQANKEMAQYAYSKDLEMWNLGNQYNTPEAQMTRLKSAGLNPNMIYGSVKATGNVASQLPNFQAPRIDYKNQSPLDIPNTINMYQDVKMKNNQNDLLREQVNLTKEKEATEIIKQHGMGYNNAIKGHKAAVTGYMSPFQQQIAESELRTIHANAKRTENSASLRGMQSQYKGVELKFLKQLQTNKVLAPLIPIFRILMQK